MLASCPAGLCHPKPPAPAACDMHLHLQTPLQAASLGGPLQPHPLPFNCRPAGLAEAHEEKNIRRRVYDALNVLEAVGMITKTKKAVRWKGWPTVRGQAGGRWRAWACCGACGAGCRGRACPRAATGHGKCIDRPPPTTSGAVPNPGCGSPVSSGACRAWGAARRTGCGWSGHGRWSGWKRSSRCWRWGWWLAGAAGGLQPAACRQLAVCAFGWHRHAHAKQGISCALQDYVAKSFCLANLALRNGGAPAPLVTQMADAGLGAPTPLLLPFILVRVRGGRGRWGVARGRGQADEAGCKRARARRRALGLHGTWLPAPACAVLNPKESC